MVNIWTTDPKKRGLFLVRIGLFLTLFFGPRGDPHFGALLGGSGGVKNGKKNEKKSEKKSPREKKKSDEGPMK